MKYKAIVLFLFLGLSIFCEKSEASCRPRLTVCGPDPAACAVPPCGRAFVSVAGGYSWSTNADVKASSVFWDPAVEGYNSSLRRSEFYDFGLGYHFRSIVSALWEVTYRPNYSYHKFQTETTPAAPESIGNKTRHFRLSNLAFTFNLFLNKTGNYAKWQCGCFSFAPFVGGGVGASYNTLYNFHSVLPPQNGLAIKEVRSTMSYRLKTAFAGQLMLGINSKINDRLSIDFGYRWFYGGKFESNNYVSNVSLGTASQVVPPWRGTVKANELYVSLNYNL